MPESGPVPGAQHCSQVRVCADKLMYNPEMKGNRALRISDQTVENLKDVEPWV